SAVAAGDRFACALKGDQTVVCWGANEAGQLGTGSVPSSLTPLAVPGLSNVSAIALGARHGGAVVGAGAGAPAACWGGDEGPELGVAIPSQLCSAGGDAVPCETTPRAVAGLTDVAALAAGARHTCAVGQDGSVWCFGANDLGQLGQDLAGDAPSARPLAVHA